MTKPVLKRLTVVLADDQPIFVEGLRLLLADSADFAVEILGTPRSGQLTLEVLAQCRPELLLLDLNLPGMDGLDILPKLKSDFPDTKILVITAYDDPKIVKASFKGGIDGYLLKSSDRVEVLDAINEVMEGETYLGKGVTPTERRPSESSNAKDFGDRFAKKHALTKREVEILKYISQALNNKDIGEQLYISDQTVSVHRKNIMRKLGVSTSASLIRLAYENQLV
jgi:DNA-binding NarL/FixJ family response regulator